MSIANQFKSAPKFKRGVAEIDLSQFYGAEPGTAAYLFRFRQPSIKEQYEIAEDAYAIHAEYPDLSMQMCLDISSLALCHLEPNPDDKEAMGRTYAELASDPERDYLYHALIEGFKTQNPYLNDFLEEVERRKKNVSRNTARHDDPAVPEIPAPDA